MNSLAFLPIKLDRRLNTLATAFERLSRTRSMIRKSDRFAVQEGLISEFWQSWNFFCRTIVLSSLKGTLSASGQPITSQYSQNSIDEIRYAAIIASKKLKVNALKPIAGDHHEPTWGDLSKFNNIISELSPSNMNVLLTAFGSSVKISDLQKIRNACAHISNERIKDVRSLQVRYNDNFFLHPSDSLYWTDPLTGDYSWVVWMDEMKQVSSAAVL